MVLKATCNAYDCSFVSTVQKLYESHANDTGHSLEFEDVKKE